MKPRDELQRDIVRQWIGKAEQDFAAAEILLGDATRLAPVIAFHAQQAVEKYLKAVLIRHQVHFPKTHELAQCWIWLLGANPNWPPSYITLPYSPRSGSKSGTRAMRRNSFLEKRHGLSRLHVTCATQ